MESHETTGLYQGNNNELEEQMFIIADDGNINMSELQLYGIDGNGENIIQIQEDEGTEVKTESYIIYDESGAAYFIDPSSVEGDAVDVNNNVNTVTSAPGMITYCCPSCTLTYQNANAFTKHMREKHFVKVYTCRQCEQFFENLSYLFLHARRTHVDPKKPRKNPDNYKFHCPDCDYMTNNGGTMEHHRRAHSGIKPYKCEICNKTFAQKANMKTHLNRHLHKERIFRCDICNKSFNSHDIYLAHLRTREHELQEHFQMVVTSKVRIQCMGCSEVFDSYFYVNKHSRSCEILKNLEKKFYCISCEKDFTDATELKHHLKGHGGNQIITCPVCGERGFPGFNQLNHHITRAHALKVNRRNVCRYCEMTFENKDSLDMHIDDMHSAEKNARQSRGAAGRMRCKYADCDFTANSVMLMERHHNHHLQNTLNPPKKIVRRSRKQITNNNNAVNFDNDFEIENCSSPVEVNEILREYENSAQFVKTESTKREQVEPEELGESIDNMGLDDLEKLAASFVDRPFGSTESRRRRGRHRKIPTKLDDYQLDDNQIESAVPLLKKLKRETDTTIPDSSIS